MEARFLQDFHVPQKERFIKRNSYAHRKPLSSSRGKSCATTEMIFLVKIPRALPFKGIFATIPNNLPT